MTRELIILTTTAASIGFIHTVLGPDHYLPFIMMARARRWSLIKTEWITFLCGLGHVGSSVVIGGIGVIAGLSVTKLESVEAFRGNIAGWLFIAFGLIYLVYGLIRVKRNIPHVHRHLHKDGSAHVHSHDHIIDHTHTHDDARSITPWILFTIFVFGPCEPLIPILMYPAAKQSLWGVVLVTGVFCLATILTMLSIVAILSLGVFRIPFGRWERYTHAIAGAIICLSGIAIQFLGL